MYVLFKATYPFFAGTPRVKPTFAVLFTAWCTNKQILSAQLKEDLQDLMQQDD